MQQERLPDRWHSRDFPVLLEVARTIDGGSSSIDRETIGRHLCFEVADVQRALGALNQAAYIEDAPARFVGGRPGSFVTTLTERGRRAVGIWPSGENVDALIDALRQAEQATADPAEQGRIRQAAGALMSVSREVMVDVIAAVVAKHTGIS